MKQFAREAYTIILSSLEAVYSILPQYVPEEKARKAISLSGVLDVINLAGPLTNLVVGWNKRAMEQGIEYEVGRLQKEIETMLGEDVAVDITFNVQDTLAYKQMEYNAGLRMLHVENTVKDMVKPVLLDVSERGENIGVATKLLQERIPELSKNHAMLIARTETLSAVRAGNQALCESTELIGEKRWRSTVDGRERSWHGVMNGVTVPKDKFFTVPKLPKSRLKKGETQPDYYPFEAYIVGEDQPYNCRCVQQAVLRDDFDVKQLKNYVDAGIRIRVLDKESRLLKTHGLGGETFTGMVCRLEKEHSRSSMAALLGVSKPTLYKYIQRAHNKPTNGP